MVFVPPFLGGPPDLPESVGPFVPGWVDVRTGSSKGDGVFVRIYYPTNLDKKKDNSSTWAKWLPHEKYLEGFAFILGYWHCVFKIFFNCIAGNKRIPAAKHGELAETPTRLKTAVFSHGMGSTRFMNTSICCELAAHGYVIAALEHQEGSAAITCYYPEKKTAPTWFIYNQIPINTPSDEHLRIRGQQVDSRAAEAGRALELLKALNAGQTVLNNIDTVFDLGVFQNRLDFEAPVMMGHSFGGATTLLTLARNSEFKCGIILDPWMFPIHRHQDLPDKITQPVLCINMQTFQTPPNLRDLDKFFAGNQPNTREPFTIRGTTHENQADSVHIIGYWLNFFMKKINPVVATRVNNALIIDFLKRINNLEIETDALDVLKTESKTILPALSLEGVSNKRKKIPHEM